MKLAARRVRLDGMVEFYENVTRVVADRPAPVFAQLRFPSCTLAVGQHTGTLQQRKFPRT